MVRHDPHDIADIGAGVASREVEETVLFCKACDLGFGMFQDQAVAFEPIRAIACADGPTKTSPAASHAVANDAF